jgi:hypothetical protein
MSVRAIAPVVCARRAVDGARSFASLLCWAVIAAVCAPAAALGQDSTSAGLTVVSRPSGAVFRITGDPVIVGRTPFTLESGLAGRFRVRSVEPGFEPWRRRIVLDGTGADTLWMVLRPKSPSMAGLRSIVLPGWGQMYEHRRAMGWAWFGSAAVASGGAHFAHRLYRRRSIQQLAAVTSEERAKAEEQAAEARRTRQTFLGAAAGIWALNALDAVLLFPKFKGGPATVSFEVSAAAREAELAVKVGF